MSPVRLHALLPAADGTGWYAWTNYRPHRCSFRGCGQDAVAFHRTQLLEKKIWRNRYHCSGHLPANLQVIGERVWVQGT